MAQPDVHTNAQNFPSFAGGGVDPRTGLYTFSLELSEILSGYLQGPKLLLALTYNPLAGDNWGLGEGWSFNLSHLSLEGNPVLALASGERYRVSSDLGEPNIRERKLSHFRLLRDSASTARLVHTSGLIEHLARPGATRYLMPVKLENANGRYLSLSYDEDAQRPRLASVQDEQGVVHLRVEKTGDTTLRLHTHTGEFVVSLASGRVEQITLPPDIGGAWSFSYNLLNNYASLSQIAHSQGAMEYIEYDSTHAFPGNRFLPMPRVTRHELSPGAGQPSLVSRYSYGSDNHNFLGFGGLHDWDAGGDDNLYRANPQYRYSVTQTQENGLAEVRTTQRTYNSFHLLIEELIGQGPNHIRRTYDYHYEQNTKYDDLPANFQQTRQVTSLWSRDDDARTRTEVEVTDYDLDGLLKRHLAVDGRETTYVYYPAEGEQDDAGEACPEDPWGFRLRLRSQTEKPASEEAGGSVKVTTWRYGSLARDSAERARTPGELMGQAANYLIVNTQQVIEVSQGTEQSRMVMNHSYHQDPNDRVSFSRLKQRGIAYQASKGTAAVDTSLETFTYTLVQGRLLQTAVDHKAYAPGASDAIEHIERNQSLLTGLIVSATDASDVTVEMTWDAAGRPLATQVVDTQYPAVRSARYCLKGESGWPEVFTIATNGAAQRTVFDGLGRERERYEINGQVQSKRWEGHYDGFGRLITETEFDTVSGQLLALTTHHFFDDWGNPCATTMPDGTRKVTMTDPLGARPDDDIYPRGNQGKRIESWQESEPDQNGKRQTSGRQCHWTNRFGKPERVETWLDEITLERRVQYGYDGWGNCIEQTDTFQVDGKMSQPAITTFEYDAWHRLTQTCLPNSDIVEHQYAAFTHEPWMSEVKAGADAWSLATIVSRQFDGLGRELSLTQGGRTHCWSYDKGLRSPISHQRPDGTLRQYTYRPSLTDAPREIVVHSCADADGRRPIGAQVTLEYDPVTARLRSASSNNTLAQKASIGCRYEYALNGEVVCETRSHATGDSITEFDYSPGQRRVKRTDSQAGTRTLGYDHAGRVETETLDEGAEQAVLVYDCWSRVATCTAAGVMTCIEYDNLGRESTRKMIATDTLELLEHLAFGWNGNGNLAWRKRLDADGEVRITERYSYDMRERVEAYSCEGPDGSPPDPDQCPFDRFGKPVVNKIYILDTLDNIVDEFVVYADGSTRETHAEFATQDPCQLRKLTHLRNGHPAGEETFEYDGNGNLTKQAGAQARTISYDIFGRPETLTPSGGAPHRYSYDTLGNLCVSGDKERFYEGYAMAHQVQGNRVQRYLCTAGMPLAVLADGAPSALLCDFDGSVVGQWDTQERRLCSAIYDAYGSARFDTEFSSDMAFKGEAKDLELYPLGRGHRFFDPALERFIAPDAATYFDGAGLNAYAYCQGNPVMLHDPTGRMPQWNATNLPFYVPPLEQPEQSQGGGGFLDGLFKAIGIGFAAWDLMVVLKGISLVATAIALPGAGTAAVVAALASLALSTAALGTAIWSIVDEDNEVAMYASIATGVVAGAGRSLAKSVMAHVREPVWIARALSLTDFRIPRPALRSGRAGPSGLLTRSNSLVDASNINLFSYPLEVRNVTTSTTPIPSALATAVENPTRGARSLMASSSSARAGSASSARAGSVSSARAESASNAPAAMAAFLRAGHNTGFDPNLPDFTRL